jgi:hypothetical protein
MPPEARENVGGDGTHLQAHETGNEFVGAGENAHAGRRKKHERVEFTTLQVFFVQVIDRAEDGEHCGNNHRNVQENAELVGADQVAVGRAGVIRDHPDGNQGQDRANQRYPR